MGFNTTLHPTFWLSEEKDVPLHRDSEMKHVTVFIYKNI